MLIQPHDHGQPPTKHRGIHVDHAGYIELTLTCAVTALYARTAPPPAVYRLTPYDGVASPVLYGPVAQPYPVPQGDEGRGGYLWDLPALGPGVYVLSHPLYTIYFEVAAPEYYPHGAYIAWLTDERPRGERRAREIATPTPLADKRDAERG